MPNELNIDFSFAKQGDATVNTLNPQQQSLIDWINEGTGSAILVARAGTGKTFTLMQAVGEIQKDGTSTVALMAYNKSAAIEFDNRLMSLGYKSGRINSGTVHSFGYRAWRQVAPDVVLNDNKLRDIVRSHRNEGAAYDDYAAQTIKLTELAKQHAFGVSAEIDDRDAWMNLIEHYDVDTNGSSAQIVTAAIRVYKESLDVITETMDFNDMILAPLYRKVRIRQYDWVLIDEAQDTNEGRRLLALSMLKPGGRLIAVGDPKQAIYGFTGADSNSLDLIKNILNCIELPLSITYRCPKSVVAEANRLVPDIQAHESSPDGVVRSIPVMVINANRPVGASTPTKEIESTMWFETERPTADDAALCRNTKPLVETAYSMIASGLGCHVEGRDIGEGLIQLATRWKRVNNLTILKEKLEDWKDREVQKWNDKDNEARAQAVEDKVGTLFVMIDHLVARGVNNVADLVTHIRNLFEHTPDGKKARVFTLSTIHKAKGREWDRVFILHRKQTLPSRYAKLPWQLEQESNLEYVAITRAKKELVYVDAE